MLTLALKLLHYLLSYSKPPHDRYSLERDHQSRIEFRACQGVDRYVWIAEEENEDVHPLLVKERSKYWYAHSFSRFSRISAQFRLLTLLLRYQQTDTDTTSTSRLVPPALRSSTSNSNRGNFALSSFASSPSLISLLIQPLRQLYSALSTQLQFTL